MSNFLLIIGERLLSQLFWQVGVVRMVFGSHNFNKNNGTLVEVVKQY
ncbi:hypothetical protein [Desulfoscipio gibsoniae]|nr:hypothetical protein [Desulfoscipio gibsoniae]